MNFFDILLAKKLENDQDPTVEGLTVTQNGSYSEQGVVYDVVNVALPLDTKTITQNGTYDASDDDLEGYSSVNVNLPLATKSITANGNYKASDDNLEGYTEVDVNVPLPSNAYLKKSVSGLPQPIASFSDGADEVLSVLVVDITPTQSGSGEPSPTNVRPISGWTGCKVNVRGINQWDEQYLSGYYNSSGVYVSQSGQICTKNKIEVIPNVTYYLGTSDYLVSNVTAICYYDKDGNFISRAFVSKGEITIPANCYYININFGATYGGTYDNDLCFNYPSTITEYVAHNPNSTTYTIPFTDSQGQSVEVFGGSVDVINGTSGNVDLYDVKVFNGSEDWQLLADGSSTRRYVLTGLTPSHKSGVGVANYLKYTTSNTGEWGTFLVPSTDSVVVKDNNNNFANITDFKTYLSEHNLQVRFERTTPTTFESQPTAVRSLLGSNNIFSDSGDVESCGYWSKTE